jgi:hypothetical protein
VRDLRGGGKRGDDGRVVEEAGWLGGGGRQRRGRGQGQGQGGGGQGQGWAGRGGTK